MKVKGVQQNLQLLWFKRAPRHLHKVGQFGFQRGVNLARHLRQQGGVCVIKGFAKVGNGAVTHGHLFGQRFAKRLQGHVDGGAVEICDGAGTGAPDGGAKEGDEIKDLSGLAKTNPLMAFVMLIFMFSLAGLPPTGGFIGKFYIFMAAVEADLVWLAVVGVLLSAVSAYYYLRVVMFMYMQEPRNEGRMLVSYPTGLAIVIAVGVVILVGVYPDPIVSWVQHSTIYIQ